MARTLIKCDLHIHTTLSDGKLKPQEVADLYGQHKFDVIAITDHIWDVEEVDEYSVPARDWDTYLRELWDVREYAWKKWELLVIPGIELTNQAGKYHILGIDLKEEPPEPTEEVETIIDKLHRQHAIAIAAHPGRKLHDPPGEWNSKYLWDHQDELRTKFDAWEVGNRDDLYAFKSIKRKHFRYIASSDFHYTKHIYSWKTAMYADKNAESVKSAIQHNLGVYIYIYRKKMDRIFLGGNNDG